MPTEPLRRLVVATLALSLAGCGGGADPVAHPGNSAEVAATPAAAKPCLPADPALSATGLCAPAATALLLSAPGTPPTAPEGCSWIVSDAQITNDTALLYRAARCKGGTARLNYAAGQPLARFVLATSAYGDTPDPNEPLAWMMPAADAAAVSAFVRASIQDPAERARCSARPATMEGWPADALVVDEAPIHPTDGIRSACGEYGLDEGAQTFWRVAQGNGWYFRLGQESPVVDAGSFTLVKRDATGAWVRS